MLTRRAEVQGLGRRVRRARGRQRTEQCGGNIPTNVGLDGKPGGEYNGQWWKGTYGWNFTIFDGEIEQIAHRNTFTAGSWPGFGNALLLTGDQSFVGVLRRQMDNIYAQKKVENGKTLLPQMYGDPKGYKEKGAPSWYHYTGNLFQDRLTEIYFWSMDRKDLERVPMRWLGRVPRRQRPGLSGEGAAGGSRVASGETVRADRDRRRPRPTRGWPTTCWA